MAKQKHYYITYSAPKIQTLSNKRNTHIKMVNIKKLRIDISNQYMFIKGKFNKNNNVYSKENIYEGKLNYWKLCELIFNTFNPMHEGEMIYIHGENANSLAICIISDGLIISDTGGNWNINQHPFANAIKQYCSGFLLNSLKFTNYEF